MKAIDFLDGADDLGSSQSAESFLDAAEPKKQNKGILGDIGTGLKRGVEQMPGMVTGIADIAAAPVSAITGINRPFSRAADYVGEKTGFQPSKWAEQAAQEYSPEMQQSLKAVEQADGFTGTLKAIGENPRSAVNLIAESLPSTLAGGILARGAMGAVVGAEKLAAMKVAGDTAGLMKAGAIAGGIGEGVVTAGQQMSQTDYSVNPLRAAGAATAAGIGTGIIGGVSGRLANRIGLADIEGSIAAGTLGAGKKAGAGAYAGRIAGGALQEGVLEELPQSAQEQVWQNLANGKPWNEGVGKASAQGLVAGMAMGAGVNALPGSSGKQEAAPPIVPPARDSINLITDPAPLQGRIDSLLGIGDKPMSDAQRTQYAKDLEASFGEVVGYASGANGLEVPVTMEDYLRSTLSAADMTRDKPLAAGANDQSANRLNQLADEEATQQPDISPATRGIAAAPAIPVVGPLSNVANMAVQSGAHQATVMQQAAAQAAKNTTPEGKAGTPAGAQKVATAPAQGPLTEVAGQAPNVATPAPNPVTPANAAPATTAGDPFIRSRTDAQLNWLAERGKPELKAAAAAEIKARAGAIAAPKASDSTDIPNGDGVTDQPTDTGIPMSEQKQTVTDVTLTNEGDTKQATESKAKSDDIAAVFRDWVAKNDRRVSAYPSDEQMAAYQREASNIMAGKGQLTSKDDFERFMRLRAYGNKFGFDLRATYAAFDNGQDIGPDGGLKIKSGANQEPVKNAAPAAATVPAESAAPDAEAIKKQGLPVPEDYKGHLIYQSEMAGGKFMVRQRKGEKEIGEPVGRGFGTAEEARAAVDAVSQPKTDAAPEAKQDKAPVSTEPARKGIRTIDKWTAEEIQARIDRGGMSPESEKKMRAELASRKPSVVSQEPELSAGAELLKARIESDKAKASDTDTRFASNTIFTADKVAAAKARMKAKLGTMNSGIDPELLIDGMTVAGAYIESGVRKFADYAKAMVEDLGDGVKPYLLSFYEAARAYPGLNKMGMDTAESAASQHQALLTPEVKEAAKEVIGETPKVEKKKPASLGESIKLKADWGVQNIDGYTPSRTGKNQQTDYGLKGGVKDEFLNDASRYLKAVAKLLEAQGFAAQNDSKGKPFKVVSTGEGGPAVGGDAYLRMSKGEFEVFAQVGVTNIRGIGPAHPQGVSLMVRAGQRNGMNNWLSTDLTAGELAAWFNKRMTVAIPAASSKLEVKNEQSAPESEPAIGEANNGTATGKQGDPVLEGLAPQSVQGTSGSEPTGDGGSGGSSGRGQGNQGTDAGRGEAGRSGGNSAAEVDTPAAGGTGPTGTGLGNNGTGRPGSGVSTTASKPGPRGKGRESAVPAVATSDVPAIPEANFEITEDVALGSGGQMTKYRDNVAAIKALKTIEAERRRATAAEKKLLARYVGWGGIPNAFRNGVTGQVAKDWEAEVSELESLLTPKELRAASASTRSAHYTAKEVVDFMWSVVKKMGFDGGLVLEPSVGTGNFIGLMPKELSGRSFVTGVELDSLTSRIAGALYPKSAIVNTGFQKAALPSNRFKLAIGNPPFGAESLRFQYRPELNGASIHNQFFLGSMDSLEPGGIMTMVVSRYLLDAKDATSREKLAIDAKLLGAVRLPGSAFKGNALTEVVTDILFFRKRDLAESQLLREAYFKRGKPIKGKDFKAINELQAEQRNLEDELRWTKTGEVKDPLGGEPMVVSQYFVDRPNMVIGTMDRSGSMRQGGDIEVSLPKGEKLADRLNSMLEKMSSLEVQSMTAEALANAEKYHKAMGESLKLSATGAEADAITFDEDGDLSTVIERVGVTGETALSPLKISPATPWSAQLQMDMDGNWFREVAKVGKDGKPVKALDKNGNPTKRNVYVREVFKKQSDIPKGLLLGETAFSKMKDLISIRDLFVNQIDLEVSRATPEQMEANRAELRNAYKAFTDKYGFISDQKNASIISDMPDEGLLMSLELSYKPEVTAAKAASTGMPAAPASAKPAAILSRPVAIPPADKTSAESAVDGLAVSLSETGRIDIARIAELRGLSEEAAMEELIGGDSPMAFKDPENGNELTEKNAYLSGNVRRKLEAAKLANMTANVKALEAVQPEPWSSDKVTARVGANWIPADTYGEFLSNLLGEKASVKYSKLTNTFEVRGTTDGAAATATWGTKRVSAVDLLQDILNSRSTRVVDRDMDGNAVFNQVETDAANDKRKEMVQAFDEWIFKDPDRRASLTQQFNDTFNTRVTPQYDGSHLAFPGKVPDEIIALRRGQVNAVWRGIIEDAVLYDHAVGAGKTFTGIARAMERRRMGMSKKPMVVVPNHMVGEWAAQAYRLYPGARVLAATKKDLEAKNRRRLFAKIASGDWDMVIVPHSSFQFISISPETEERLLMEELAMANAALKDAEEDAEPGSRFKPLSVKSAEALIEKIEKRLEAARGRLGKDKLLMFEQMGVDDLTIDEAHEFKNLFYSSNLTDVRGMGNKTGSDKAFDLHSKTRVIREMQGSLAFLTGTPISNSAVEAYNILRYLAPESLKESGLEHFDAFRSQYVDATAKFEPTDSGGGLKLVTRLGRSWSNMRSLMELYYSVADVVTNDDIKRWYAEDNPGKEFPLPKVKSGDRIPVSVDATPTQMRLLQDTIAAFDGLDGIKDIKERNAERLRLMDRARKLSLHARAVDPTLDDEPGGKLDKVADKASEIYRKSMADKGTQLIFLDRGVPKAKGDDKIIKEYDDLTAKLRQASLANNEEEARKLVSRLDKFDANEIEELRAAQNSNWSGYQHIKDRLIEQGVPANEIAFVQDFNGDAAKEQLFQAVRDGAIRILIGSTPRMGAGTNVQERLVALHHVDATWKPSDIEQREGRIIRQGNALAFDSNGNPRPGFEIEIYAYVTKRTVDAKLWDLNSTKLRMINAIRYYDGQFEMDFDDEAAVGMAEIAAIASGDPLLLERFKLSTEIDNLYRAKSSHRRRIESAEDSLRSAKRLVENAPAEMAESKEDAKLRAEFSKAVKEDADTREVTMAGKRYVFGDIGQINVDYAKIVDGIGEDEKFSLVIDGKEYTSKSAAEEAIKAAIGDVEPFVAEVDGKKITRRSDYARAIREKIGDEIGYEQEVKATPMGSIGGIPVSVEISNKWGSASVYLGLTGKYESTGRRRTVVGQRYLAPEKHKKGDPYPLSVNALRPVISDFEKSVGYLWDGSDRIKESAEKAKKEIPALEALLAEKFKGQEELDAKSDRLATVEAELAGRKAEEEAKNANPSEESAGNIAAPGSMSPADKAIYGMAAEGKSAAEVLKFIASASRNPFNRQVARLLLKTGIAPNITVGDGKTWKISDAKSGEAFAAAYDPKTNTVALFRPASAERNALHELIHAASLKALAKNGLASAQMKALFAHVEKTGKLTGMYGIRNVDEFIAEAFSNPKFQAALKQVSAAPVGGKPSSEWDWFIRVVRVILGLKQGQDNALSQALEIGLGVMRENMALQSGDGVIRFNHALRSTPEGNRPLNATRLAELRRIAAGLERPKDAVFLRVTEDGKAITTGPKGVRIPETFIRFAESNGLDFEARRNGEGRKSDGHTVGDHITSKTEPMPEEYRESGALYFGEGNEFFDRTGKTRYNAAPGKKSWSANDYQKRADQLDRAFAAMGLESVRESSRASASEYVKVNDPNDETIAYKLRISNHRLPSGYTQPDFDVIADGVEHDGAMWNASGTWIDAVNWIADKTGKEPRGIIKTMANKRRAELDSARRAESAEREKAKAQYSDQSNRIVAEKIRLSDWIGALPQGSTLSVSNKGRLNATTPSGEAIQYGTKPFGMANSTKTIADARKYIESTPAPNSAATRLPGAPDKAGMQERSKTEPAQSKSGAGSDANVTDSADNGNGIRYNAAPGKINQTSTTAFDIDRAWRDLISRNKFSDFDQPPVFEATRTDEHSIAAGMGKPPRSFVLSKKTNGKWVSLSIDEHQLDSGETVFSSSLEASSGYPKGTGVATKMYLSAVNVAKQRGMGWVSESIRSDESLATYDRLKKAGIPFYEKNGASHLDSAALANVNLQDVANRLANQGIRYNVADEGWSVSEQAKETVMRLAGRPMLDPSDPFAAENARLREQDQSLWSKAKKQLRRYLAPGGLLPQSVFAEKIKRDSEFQAVEFDVRHLIGGLEHAVKADFGMAFDKLSKEQMRPITEALAGNMPASLPEATKTAAVAMRQYIDGMSTEYLKIIQQKIDAKMLKALESGKDSDKAQAINEIELFEKIKGNIGRYVHRSYQAFDDPKWFEKVPAHVINASRLYLKQGYMEAGETDAKAAQLAEVTLHEILKNGTAYDSMESFIAESKLGAKDLSVLMRRKEVPAQIRALLGEYPDARLNFTKSATKMGRLIWNTRFLDRVRDMGMGSFFFEGKDRPPNATTQIAADGSEVYAPLNGLWTFPETAQAFKDALGKEQMSDLYRAIVRANGLVKYGKTVLAPTTAMRNWQSAMFFSLANGHFDLTQMKKSISAFREQVSQTATGGDLKYLRHLKQLGVVYDTPYAGEMARLMEDARMEELLSSDKGDAVRWFRKANQLAQGFYTFGDDFWKIIGFENEKAGLMKAGLSLQEAEIEAAKRIRDTYPTYSMVGRGVQWLSRFPLAGTFVSFPAEIIRTSGNMLRTVAADLKSDNPKLRELGMKRAAGMVFVSAAFYSLAALSMAMAGVGDDEDEAIRDLVPEWQKNSTFLYLGRDEKGNLRYFDMSFLDPYGYWKRPITAMLRNQPWEDSLASGLRGMLEPFLGADISAKAIFEAVSNAKESGGKVYKENDGAIDQAVDIADHLRKALQPGVIGNVERLVKASADVRKSSGQPYSMEDELVALAGWRATTIEPKTALYYRSFEFTDSLAEARKTLTDTLRDANDVSPEDIKDARERAKSKQEQAFKEMSRLVGAAEAAGMSKMQIVQTLRLSNISQANIASLMRGATPDVSITPQLAARAVRQASQMRGPEFAADVFDRYRQAMAK